MKVFTCKDFTGHYPVGTAAVIIAESKHKAMHLLIAQMLERGLLDLKFTLEEVDMSKAAAIILCDGNY